MKFVFGLPVALAAEQRAIVGELTRLHQPPVSNTRAYKNKNKQQHTFWK